MTAWPTLTRGPSSLQSALTQFPSSHRVGDGSRGLGAGTQLYVTISVPLSRLLREQMGSLELGDPRDTLEPKAMKEQEDSMGPQDPSVYR